MQIVYCMVMDLIKQFVAIKVVKITTVNSVKKLPDTLRSLPKVRVRVRAMRAQQHNDEKAQLHKFQFIDTHCTRFSVTN